MITLKRRLKPSLTVVLLLFLSKRQKYVPITIGSQCKVCVLDNTPPSSQLADLSGTLQTAIDISPRYLWGTTGESLTNNKNGKANPAKVVFVDC